MPWTFWHPDLTISSPPIYGMFILYIQVHSFTYLQWKVTARACHFWFRFDMVVYKWYYCHLSSGTLPIFLRVINRKLTRAIKPFFLIILLVNNTISIFAPCPYWRFCRTRPGGRQPFPIELLLIMPLAVFSHQIWKARYYPVSIYLYNPPTCNKHTTSKFFSTFFTFPNCEWHSFTGSGQLDLLFGIK